MLKRFHCAPSCSAVVTAPFISSLRYCSSNSNNNNNNALLSLHEEVDKLIINATQAPDSTRNLQNSMLANPATLLKPWEASCLEVVSSSSSCSPQQQHEEAEHKVKDSDDPYLGSYVVLYYETSTSDGLAAFRSVARRVADRQLPGVTENRMAYGFAVWRVPARDFQELNARPKLT